MTLKNDPVFAQIPAVGQATVSAANTGLDGSGTITELLTAGADGAIVTSLKAFATVTSTAKRLNLFISTDAGTTWKLFDSALMEAYTVANTTAQTAIVFIDKADPNAAVRLPASAKLGVSIMVAEAVQFVSEYTDY